MQQYALERNGSSHEMLRFALCRVWARGRRGICQKDHWCVTGCKHVHCTFIGIGNVVRISLTRKAQRHFLNSLCHITVTLKFVYFTKTKSGGIPNMTSTSSVCVQETNTNSQGILVHRLSILMGKRQHTGISHSTSSEEKTGWIFADTPTEICWCIHLLEDE